ncbi:protein of unknown function [Nitrosotalea devaniterrae]|uniref:Roadblock/LAMTOR2 domain-containing protein n=1 Tax=Nitrosotalea devaniterrae TaxID=1078905 RepID=A0A128A3X1_9ARCH|nr:protein of unknown function [Candidatus Nitrosotalea devanaterra]
MNNTLEFDELCDNILDINNNIQSVSIINKHGRPVERKTSDECSSQVTEQKIEMFFMQCVLTISMGRDFDTEFGEIGYVHVDRRNLSMFSFPVFDHIVLVTSKAAMSPITLAKKISTTIKKYKNSQHVGIHSLGEDTLSESPRQEMIQITST